MTHCVQRCALATSSRTADSHFVILFQCRSCVASCCDWDDPMNESGICAVQCVGCCCWRDIATTRYNDTIPLDHTHTAPPHTTNSNKQYPPPSVTNNTGMTVVRLLIFVDRSEISSSRLFQTNEPVPCKKQTISIHQMQTEWRIIIAPQH